MNRVVERKVIQYLGLTTMSLVLWIFTYSLQCFKVFRTLNPPNITNKNMSLKNLGEHLLNVSCVAGILLLVCVGMAVIAFPGMYGCLTNYFKMQGLETTTVFNIFWLWSGS